MDPHGGQDTACALFGAQDVGSPSSGSREGTASNGLSRAHGPPAGRAGHGRREEGSVRWSGSISDQPSPRTIPTEGQTEAQGRAVAQRGK